MDAILRLKQTKLFLQLLENEKKEGNQELSNKVEHIVKMAAPLLQKIPENMPEYTLHDPIHSAKIIDIMGKILPDEVLQNLNIIEISLLIISAYLHDIGMTCDKQEKEKIINENEDYKILFKSNVDKFQKFQQYKLEKNHRAATFIEDQIFTEYLRRNHVKRSAIFIKEKLENGEFILSYNEIPFYKLLIKICDSHGEPVKKLYDTNIWPRETLVGDNIINVQYLSLILRLADILDLDSERTPKIIYEFVNPEDPTSILEWKKHRSIIGTSINSTKIFFEAECSSPEVERALRQFLDWIEIERKETIELLKTYRPEEASKYFLTLLDPVTKDRIHSDGSYIYSDLTFSLDYQRIMSLLMGQKLYKDPTTAIRELLQNSIDAIKVRQKFNEDKVDKINPFIKISLFENTLSIEDNGIGMDETIFNNYFLQIGKSYYSSPIFYSKFSEIDVTSEFGIGILSVFMIASSFNIESRRDPENPITPFPPINYEIPAAHSFLIQREGHRKEIGTKIILKLKENNPFNEHNIYNILEEILPNPIFEIKISTAAGESVYNGKKENEIQNLNYSEISMDNFFYANRISEIDWYNSYTHSLLKVDFNDKTPSLLNSIKGNLLIVNSNPINYYGSLNGYVCQRGFTVGFPETIDGKFIINTTESIKQLFPKWLSFYSTLNFTNDASLSITPDRSDLTIDEKFKILKIKIENKIIDTLRNHFDEFILKNGIVEFEKYLDFLFVSGFFGIDLDDTRKDRPLSKEAKSFLSDYISFPTLKSDGSIHRTLVKDLKKNENIAAILNYKVTNFIP